MHRLLLGPRAQRDLDRAGRGHLAEGAGEALASLSRTLRPKGCLKLSTGAWRVRVGEIRVLYDIDNTTRTVEVLRVKHRRDVYRHRS